MRLTCAPYRGIVKNTTRSLETYFVEKTALRRFFLAGVAGFGPANNGVKDRCLTAWRYPCLQEPIIIQKPRNVNEKMCAGGSGK